MKEEPQAKSETQISELTLPNIQMKRNTKNRGNYGRNDWKATTWDSKGWKNDDSWTAREDYEAFEESSQRLGAVSPGEVVQRLISEDFVLSLSPTKGTFVKDVKIGAIKIEITHDENMYNRKMLTDKDNKIKELEQKIKTIEKEMTDLKT
jgi:hypothetical protein